MIERRGKSGSKCMRFRRVRPLCVSKSICLVSRLKADIHSICFLLKTRTSVSRDHQLMLSSDSHLSGYHINSALNSPTKRFYLYPQLKY